MNSKKFSIFLLFLSIFFTFGVKPVWAANYQLEPASADFAKDSNFDVTIRVNLGADLSNGADAIVEYDSGRLQVAGVSGGAYEKFSQQSASGRLTINAYSLTPANYVSGDYKVLATVRFRAISEGNVSVRFVCTGGATNESNIWKKDNGDVIDCGALNQASFNITSGGASQASPSPGTGGSGGTGGQGGGGSGGGSQPSGCTAAIPANPGNLQASTGPGSGQATLTWNQVSGATHYNLVYGLSSRNYIYGAPNIGNTNRFVVSLLRSGTRYYFSVTAVNDCASSGYSNEVSAVAGQAPRSAGGTGRVTAPLASSAALSGASPADWLTVSPGPAVYDQPLPSDTVLPSEEPEASLLPQPGPTINWFYGLPLWLKIILGVGVLFLLFMLLSGLRGKKDNQPPESANPGQPTSPVAS